MVILGSGSIVSQLTEARLIDEYQIVLNAIVLETVTEKQKLKLIQARPFTNGNVVLCYEPTATLC